MPKFVIERIMPGAGRMSHEELSIIARRSCQALEALGPMIQWVESFVTKDKVYSVYIAPHERLIREHAHLSGFPADSICRVEAIVDPSVARAGEMEHHRDMAKEAGVY